MKWLLHTDSLNLRGTTVAVRDYSQGLLEMGHEVAVAYRASHPDNDINVIKVFSHLAELMPYEVFSELEETAHRRNVERAYFIKSGERDGKIFSSIFSCVHAVFPTHVSEIHGDAFAFVSEWLSIEFTNRRVPWVPHIVNLPSVEGSLREELNIPRSALVFGGMGGAESFDIDFVRRVIVECVEIRSDLYFLFLNIKPFAQHERILFLPGNSSLESKARFIQSCDAMIHARGLGESFGLSCAEFSSKNKRVVTYAFSPQLAHIHMLGDSAIVYRGSSDLRNILLHSRTQDFRQGIWDSYSTRFSPDKVMEMFSKYFMNEGCASMHNIRFSGYDQVRVHLNTARRRAKKLEAKFWTASSRLT